jgi:hypothetical protein
LAPDERLDGAGIDAEPSRRLIMKAVMGWVIVISQVKRIAELETQVAEGGSSAGSPGQEIKGAQTQSRDLESRVARLEAQVLKGQVNTALASNRHPNQAGQMPAGGPEKLLATPGQKAESAQILEVLESYDPQVRDRLKAVIQEEQDRLRDERWEMRNQRWQERTEKQISEFSENAKLSAQQSAEISTLLTSEREQISALFQQARQDMSFGEARQKARDLRDENDAKAKEILDEDQITAFMEMREESGFGRGSSRRQSRNQNQN